jgi:hypothetical protein
VFGMTAPASISASGLASVRFGDLAGDGRPGGSTGGEVESGLVAVTMEAAAGITGIVAATMAVIRVLQIAAVRTRASVAASTVAIQVYAQAHSAASATALKAGAFRLAANKVSAVFVEVASVVAVFVVAASTAEAVAGASPA